jgi:hypothetical protein
MNDELVVQKKIKLDNQFQQKNLTKTVDKIITSSNKKIESKDNVLKGNELPKVYNCVF